MEEVLDYEGLVYSIILKYPKRYDKDDLFQVGMIGLMNAYKHYDSSFNTKFSSFAYYYIVGEVNKYIRENSGIKLSKSYIDLNKKIINARDLMRQKLGREPTNVEVSLYLEVDEELIDMAIISNMEVESLDNIYNDAKIYDNTSPEVLDLKVELEKLSDFDKRIIKARYYDELTQKETSNLLGISQVQVSRNETKILQKLRNSLYS